jgi:hypothetical protein
MWAFALLAGACFAQSQAPVTKDELQYFRFMLMNLASLDHSPTAVAAFEAALVPQHGLNAQEAAQIHAAGQTLAALLQQIRSSANAITAGKKTLSDSDTAALQALINQRDQLLETLANQILNSVRPETAGRLRKPGQIMAAGVKNQTGK